VFSRRTREEGRRKMRTHGSVRSPRRRYVRPVAPVLAALALAASACSDSDPVAPAARLAGTYEATTWTMSSDAGTFDLLAAGSSLAIELRADGATAGEFHTVEDAAPGVTERRVDLAGTWSLGAGDVVTFDMDGDTYVRFVEWQHGAGRLENELSIGGWTTRTVLRRQ
jgi:hypothetical protein